MSKKNGRPLKYKTPEDLELQCQAYFDYRDKTPWYKNEAVKSGVNAGDIIQVPTLMPYTLISLCDFLGISQKCWYTIQSILPK